MALHPLRHFVARHRHPIGLRLLVSLLAALPVWVEAAAPAAPSNLTVSFTFPLASPVGSKAYHTYLFQWTDQSTDELGFELYARLGTSDPFSSLGTIAANSTLITTRLNAFTAGTTLQFRIRSYKGPSTARQFSAYSTPAQFVIPSSGDFSAPQNLAATNATRDRLRLTWDDASEREDFYVIELKLSTSSNWSFYALPFFNIKEFFLTESIEPGRTYDFRVRGLQLAADTRLAINPATGLLAHVATDANGQNPTYSVDGKLFYTEATTITNRTIPDLSAPPTQIRGTAVDEKTMRLNWFDESDKEHGYEIQNLQGTTTYSTWDYTLPNATSYDITNVAPLTSATWKIRAAYQRADRQIVTSASSAEVTITTPFFAPTEVIAKASPDADVINLSWRDNSKVESGYAIYTRTPGNTNPASDTLQKTVDPGTTSTTVTGLSPGTAYDFVVRAFYNTGTQSILSDPSPPSRATTRNGFIGSVPNRTVPGPFTHQLQTSTSLPRTSWAVDGLPPGLSFNEENGVISGSATQSGVFPVTLKATFADGSTNQTTFTLRIALPPGAPIVIPAGNRRVAVGSSLSIPLSSLFKDPDTESAVRLTTNLGSHIDVILYPSATPLTVANFLAYTNGGDYTGVSFHRTYAESPIDIIQGGAFKPDTASGPDRFTRVASRGSVLNEPGISNRPGTIAMAKLGGDPNSATHDFFFNRVDSSSPSDPNALDNQNGGFTVFGRVAGSGMTVVDQIAGLPKANYSITLDGQSASFEGWPINDSTAPSSMDNTKNVVITNAAVVPALSIQVTGNTNPSEVTANIVGNNLIISGSTDGQTSDLTLRATDLDGSTAEQTFTVQIDDAFVPPVVNSDPIASTVKLGTTATFVIQAAGTQPISYQWRKNGVDLPGETSPSLSIPQVAYADEAAYTVTVTNEAGIAVSSPAALTVRGIPQIVSPPSSITRTYRYSATFSVVAVGAGPLRYQWLKGNSRIPGATGSTYSIPAAEMTDATTYRVVVTNSSGSTTSPAATLTVLPIDSDADGVFDHEELAAKANLSKTDSDGDGYDDAAELEFGGNPALATRKPTGFFVARTDGPAAMRDMLFRRVPETSTPSNLPAFWLGAYELSNRQFASILQYAYQQNLIQLDPPVGGRRAVKYQGEVVCFLATHRAADPGHVGFDEVDFRDRGGFFVRSQVADHPARGVTWHGAYLATVAMNAFAVYSGKNVPATWEFGTANGYYLPSDAEWEWAARSGAADLAYPTGAGATAAQANFASQFGKTKPVSSHSSNAFGIFNLAGNVAEWVFEPTGNTADAYARGGGWLDPLSALANNTRATLLKTTANSNTGIRLALKGDPAIGGADVLQIATTDRPLTLDAGNLGVPRIVGQWHKGDVAMTGRTSPLLTFPTPKLTDAGTYNFLLSNLPGSSPNSWTSPDVQIAIIDAPLTPQAVPSGIGIPVTFRVPYAGSSPTFQWRKDGNVITDGSVYDIVSPATATGVATLTVLSPAMDSTGSYTCRVTFGSQTQTITFNLGVVSPPQLNYDGPNTILNAAYTFGIVDTHALRNPASVSISGLPRGLTYDRVTGLITGKPTQSGSFNLLVTVANINGNYSFPFTLLVQALNTQTVGSFVGLVGRHSLNNSLGGRVEITTTASGSYSGRLILGTITHRFSGILNATISPAIGSTNGGDASFQSTIARAGQTSLQLNVALNATNNLATGTLQELIVPAPSVPPASAAINGWRTTWSTKVKPSTRLGRHNFMLAVPDGVAPIPRGFGTGFLQISTGGTASITGNLSDGSPFTSSAALGPNGEALIFKTLYGNAGSVLGTLLVREGPNKTVLVTQPLSGTATWRKPAIPTDRLYPEGLGLTVGNTFTMTARGGLYTAPAKGKLILGLPDVTAPAAENIRLVFNHGGISSPQTDLNVPSIAIRPTAAITMPGVGVANPAAATLKVEPTTGGFSGTVLLADGSRPSVRFQGMIARDSKSSSLTTSLSGSNNDLVFSSQEAGPDVNLITIRYVDPSAPSALLSITVVDKAITVNLATGPGIAQVETATVGDSAVSTDGTLNVVVTASGVSGSPLSIPVALTTGQNTTALIATAIRNALAGIPALTSVYVVGGSDSAITLTKLAAAANDSTLNVEWGSEVPGVSPLATSTNSVSGVAPAITTTAAQVKAAIEANVVARSLVFVAYASGNDGSGAVGSLVETFLSGGSDGKLRGFGYFLMPQVPGNGQTINTSPILSGAVLLEETP